MTGEHERELIMLTTCKACAAVNVLDVERAATGKARCMICRKRLGLPDEEGGPQSRSSFPVSANLEAAVVDPSRGISEDMESELTPLMPLHKVKELLEGTVPGAAIMWNDVTKTDPIRVDIEVAKTQSFDIDVTGEVDPRDIIDTENLNAEKSLFVDSAKVEEVAPLELLEEDQETTPEVAQDFKEETAPFDLSRPSEKSRISENLPMVFDCQDPSLVSTVPSIPAAKRHKLSLLAASIVIFALGTTDLLSTRANEKRLAAASSQQPTSNWVLVQPAAAPAAPPPQAIAEAPETNSISVESLPVDIANPQPTHATHRRAQPRATEGEKLTQAGDVAMKKNDLTSARAAYALALASNPTYFPARLGAADVAWAAGDHAKAREAYRAISESFPSDMLPARVFEREVASR